MELSVLVIFGIALAGGVFWLIFLLLNRRSSQELKSNETLDAQIENLNRRLEEKMHLLGSGLNQQLSGFQQTLDRRLDDSSKRLDQRLDGAARSYADVQKSLEQVRQSSERI